MPREVLATAGKRDGDDDDDSIGDASRCELDEALAPAPPRCSARARCIVRRGSARYLACPRQTGETRERPEEEEKSDIIIIRLIFLQSSSFFFSLLCHPPLFFFPFPLLARDAASSSSGA